MKRCRIIRDKNKRIIPILVKKIKKIEFLHDLNFLKLIKLSDSIFGEWLKIRKKLRKKIINKKITESLYAKYESEEEIVIGLINLLNTKIISFVYLHKLDRDDSNTMKCSQNVRK